MNARKKIITAISLTFLLAGLLALPFALSYVDTQGQPPCDLPPSSIADEKMLSVCDLAHGKAPDKPVRVSGTFYNDSQQLSLRGLGCSMIVGLADPKRGCTGAWRRLQMLSGIQTWYDGDADVTVVGRLGRIPAGNYYEGQPGFVMSCVEQVRSAPKLRDRIRYSIHRLAD
jgi:hypothetical protein